ncbi:YciI family protein [Sphingomonas sp. RT2P30]|uniref:YciI family protein n=1 Tax=Parasphingomonas halimpatiens TaxID=3096162 RepID=UPI002FCB581B
MQYIMLIYEDERGYGPDKAGDAMNRIVAGHMALSQELGAKQLGGAGLLNTPTATTVRTTAGGDKIVHDGPFAETREQLGGYYLIEADDLDDAIAIARRIPILAEGAVEIRPLLGQDQRKAG